eukprot:gnl/Hemi2/25475_TR8570_c0_g1_i1.p1 gnl/Hemi2/25475_TR8570_c0_g1~~gnl/Hemi2/25475_TR8570_c0_g1_i1.p1  ORF type:complete len:154 (-),score=36.71 gnl/Hemi2/25475_TR8570_c0_g1_i1:233-694(-)
MFQQYVFDPRLILAQIGALQSLFYLTLSLLLSGFDWLFGLPVSRLWLLFDSQSFSATSGVGWVLMAVFLLTACVCGWYMGHVVERARQCLDFAVTLYLVHFVFAALVGGLSSTWQWWVCMLVCITLTTVLGEAVCIKRDMQDIPVGNPNVVEV